MRNIICSYVVKKKYVYMLLCNAYVYAKICVHVSGILVINVCKYDIFAYTYALHNNI